MARGNLNRGDQVLIHFTDQSGPPYRMQGTFVSQSDTDILIEGTVGEWIGRDLFIPRDKIKLVERIERVREEG